MLIVIIEDVGIGVFDLLSEDELTDGECRRWMRLFPLHNALLIRESLEQVVD